MTQNSSPTHSHNAPLDDYDEYQILVVWLVCWQIILWICIIQGDVDFKYLKVARVTAVSCRRASHVKKNEYFILLPYQISNYLPRRITSSCHKSKNKLLLPAAQSNSCFHQQNWHKFHAHLLSYVIDQNILKCKV